MNNELKLAVETFISKASESGQTGKAIDKNECIQLNEKLNLIIPEWYQELITTYPLSGIEFMWQAFEPKEDFDGLSTIWWADADNIYSETSETMPGAKLLKEGYFCVACDNDGIGDPYFINSTDGENSTVYQVSHELLAESELIISGFTAAIVGKKLSEVFDNAIFKITKNT
ncbi:MAG: SMI1/KNR4 family protein [Gammaproteobacteria bacterium]